MATSELSYEVDKGFSQLKPSYVEDIKNNRETIQSTAKSLKEMVDSGEIEGVDCPVTHRFVNGCYLREIFMPKGSRVIGKIHATEHFNIVLAGECTVITAEGIEEIKAPHTFISKAGVQKVVIVHEDCQWQTIHLTDKKDLDEIEKEVIVEEYDQLLVDGLLMKSQELLS